MKYFTGLLLFAIGSCMLPGSSTGQIITNSTQTDTIITRHHIEQARHRPHHNKSKPRNGMSRTTKFLGGLAKSLLLATWDHADPNFEYDPFQYPEQNFAADRYQDYLRLRALYYPEEPIYPNTRPGQEERSHIFE